VDAAALGEVIAPLNAALNFTSFLCLSAGFVLIRRGNREAHRKAMLGAVAASVLFLVFYVIRFSLTGTHRFAGEGFARSAYLVILFSHMILAVVVVPLVLRLLYLAFKDRFQEHRRLARWTFPIWLYVSVTGIVVYLMLYQVYGYV
jgi:putative membrane protein